MGDVEHGTMANSVKVLLDALASLEGPSTKAAVRPPMAA